MHSELWFFYKNFKIKKIWDDLVSLICKIKRIKLGCQLSLYMSDSWISYQTGSEKSLEGKNLKVQINWES